MEFTLFFLNWLRNLMTLFIGLIFIGQFSFLAIISILIEIKQFPWWRDNLSPKSNILSSILILFLHRILFLLINLFNNLGAKFQFWWIILLFKNIGTDTILNIAWITLKILEWIHLIKLKVGALLWRIFAAYFFHYFLERF